MHYEYKFIKYKNIKLIDNDRYIVKDIKHYDKR